LQSRKQCWRNANELCAVAVIKSGQDTPATGEAKIPMTFDAKTAPSLQQYDNGLRTSPASGHYLRTIS
jgi:hypothetical protein